MAWIYISVSVAVGTAIWIIGRWAMRSGARADVYGFWISIVAALVSGAANAFFGKPFAVGPVWVAGGVLGFAFSVGFCVLIMGALKVGPVGPTTTLNNMAMVCGVLYGIVWLRPHMPNGWVVGGIAGAAAALILLGMGDRKSSAGSGFSRTWVSMVIPGSALSGLSIISQTHVATLYPGNVLLYSFAGFAVSAVILAALILVQSGSIWRRREMVAGIGAGALVSMSMAVSLSAISLLGAEIALPIMVATPIIFVLLLGHFLFGERLRKTTVAACILGAMSVAMLSFGSRL